MEKMHFGIIGKDVETKSFSPAMHSAAFEELKLNADYKPFNIKDKNQLENFFKEQLFSKKLNGINVTNPYKTAVLEFLSPQGLSPEVSKIGAVNTIHQDGDQLKGYNTDAGGFRSALNEFFGSPKGKNCVVLGSGGAARAVVFVLAGFHVNEVSLLGRDTEKTGSLEKDVKKWHPDLKISNRDPSEIHAVAKESDLLINATPCGEKAGDNPYIDFSCLHKNMFVFDLVYNPSQTPLLKEAEKIGCRWSNGVDMLLYQGMEAFTIWTGEKPPKDEMKNALESFLYQS